MTHQRTRRCISLWNITSYELGLLQWIRFIFRKCLMRQVLNKSPWTCHGNVFIRTSLAPVFSLSLTVTISRCKRWMFSHNILYVLARKIINFFFYDSNTFFWAQLLHSFYTHKIPTFPQLFQPSSTLHTSWTCAFPNKLKPTMRSSTVFQRKFKILPIL